MTGVYLTAAPLVGAAAAWLVTAGYYRHRTVAADVHHYRYHRTAPADVDQLVLEIAEERQRARAEKQRAGYFRRQYERVAADMRAQAGLIIQSRRPIPLGPTRTSRWDWRTGVRRAGRWLAPRPVPVDGVWPGYPIPGRTP